MVTCGGAARYMCGVVVRGVLIVSCSGGEGGGGQCSVGAVRRLVLGDVAET